MIRPPSTPREWGRGLRCSLTVDPFLGTILLLTEISINWFYFCQTPYQYPHSMLSTKLNYSDRPLPILLNMCFDFQQSTKMRTVHFMQTSKPPKAIERSISLKIRFTNWQGITRPASSIPNFHGQLLLSRPQQTRNSNPFTLFCTNGQVEKVKNSFFRATGTPKSRLHRRIFAKTLAHLQP